MESIRATYLLPETSGDPQTRAEQIAREQTTELPEAAILDPFVRGAVLGRVDHISRAEDGSTRAVIDYPLGSQDGSAAQLLNVLFGNSSMHADVSLIDAEIPDTLIGTFPGPQHGVAGLRRIAGEPDRALTSTALKPQGLSVDALARLCETFARAGIDVIKDDHGLADQRSAPFAERVVACQAAVERVADETGRLAVYAPNLLGAPLEVSRRLALAANAGVRAVLIEPMLMGLPAFAELTARNHGLPVLAHPSFTGVARIGAELLFGKLLRLFGADAVIFPHEGGRFRAFDEAACRGITKRLRAPWCNLRASLPVPAGGMTVERVGEILEFYGPDSMLLVGGSLYVAGEALLERSSAFVRAVCLASAVAQGGREE